MLKKIRVGNIINLEFENLFTCFTDKLGSDDGRVLYRLFKTINTTRDLIELYNSVLEHYKSGGRLSNNDLIFVDIVLDDLQYTFTINNSKKIFSESITSPKISVYYDITGMIECEGLLDAQQKLLMAQILSNKSGELVLIKVLTYFHLIENEFRSIKIFSDSDFFVNKITNGIEYALLWDYLDTDKNLNEYIVFLNNNMTRYFSDFIKFENFSLVTIKSRDSKPVDLGIQSMGNGFQNLVHILTMYFLADKYDNQIFVCPALSNGLHITVIRDLIDWWKEINKNKNNQLITSRNY